MMRNKIRKARPGGKKRRYLKEEEKIIIYLLLQSTIFTKINNKRNTEKQKTIDIPNRRN